MVIFIGIFIVRYIAASVTVSVKKEMREDKALIYSMLPRGLAAAVIVALPFTIPEFQDTTTSYYAELAPHRELFMNMAFMMIVISVIATTIGVSLIEASRRRKANADAEAQKDDWSEKSRMYKKHSSGKEKYESVPAYKWKLDKGKKNKQQPVVRKHADTPASPPSPARTSSQFHAPTKKTGQIKPEARVTGKPKARTGGKSHPLLKRAEEAEKRSPKKGKK